MPFLLLVLLIGLALLAWAVFRLADQLRALRAAQEQPDQALGLLQRLRNKVLIL